MGKTAVLLIEQIPALLRKDQAFNFTDLPLQLLAFALQRLGTAAGCFQRGSGIAPVPPGQRNLGRRSRQAGMAIEQRALRIATQQGLVGMLTMDVDQPLGHFAQLLHGGRRTVDPDP